MTQRCREIRVPILNDEYAVIVCIGDAAYLRRRLMRWGHEPGDNLAIPCRGRCYNTFGSHPVIVLRTEPRSPTEVGTLAHEAVHAIFGIMRHIEQHTDWQDEVIPLSVGAIVRRVLATQKTPLELIVESTS